MKSAILGLVLVMSNIAMAHSRHPGHHPGHGHHSPAGQVCAVVYQGFNFSGNALAIFDGQAISSLEAYPMSSYPYDLGTWNNRISSLEVRPGCVMVSYQYDNFGRHWRTGERIGSAIVSGGAYGEARNLNAMDDLISSLTCNCR